jgi:hypothetical protein
MLGDGLFEAAVAIGVSRGAVFVTGISSTSCSGGDLRCPWKALLVLITQLLAGIRSGGGGGISGSLYQASLRFAILRHTVIVTGFRLDR